MIDIFRGGADNDFFKKLRRKKRLQNTVFMSQVTRRKLIVNDVKIEQIFFKRKLCNLKS